MTDEMSVEHCIFRRDGVICARLVALLYFQYSKIRYRLRIGCTYGALDFIFDEYREAVEAWDRSSASISPVSAKCGKFYLSENHGAVLCCGALHFVCIRDDDGQFALVRLDQDDQLVESPIQRWPRGDPKEIRE